MRPLLALLALVVVAIGLAWFTTRVHPGGTLPPAEVAAEEDQAKADAAKKAEEQMSAKLDTSSDAFDKVKDGAIRAKMEIEGRGTLILEFYPKAAPKTVEHIVDLTKKRFYDGVKVHRVETKGISVVQLGDPKSKNVDPSQFEAQHVGGNGSGTLVPLEIDLPHVKNSIGMARQQDLNSGDSQFYFNVTDNHELDGKYCVFGRVVEGADLLPQLKVGDVIKSMSIQ